MYFGIFTCQLDALKGLEHILHKFCRWNFLHNYRYLCLTKCLSIATGEKLVILEKLLSDCKVDEVRTAHMFYLVVMPTSLLLTLKRAFMTR